MKYDYLIVGSGFSGSVFAYEMSRRNFKCLVLERRGHIGGNAFTDEIDGIRVHRYGAHIFHTSREDVWNYIRRFSRFNHFINAPIANYEGEIYNLPFNMNTFSKMWGVRTPAQAREIIRSQREGGGEPQNLEEQAIRLVGWDLYEKLIKGYTQKQWGRPCNLLPASIIRRIPVRFTFDNNYFNDPYQGIPVGGYTPIFEKMLEKCDVRLEADFLADRRRYESMAEKVIYTGPIDAYYESRYGPLAYRSLRFEHETLETPNYQGVAVINYTDMKTPYTRVIEHKHFEFEDQAGQEKTVITREYPLKWEAGLEPFYPVNDALNNRLYQSYAALAAREKNIRFIGRLARYQYLDMDQTIADALELARSECREKGAP